MELINKIFTFENTTSLMIYGTVEKPYFMANVVAKLLGYKNTNQAINDHVWPSYTITMKELQEIKPFSSINLVCPFNILYALFVLLISLCNSMS